MIAIPSQQDKKWIQKNKGELLGNIYATRNMNFDKYGYAKLARRSTALIYNVSQFSSVTSISTLDSSTYYAMTSGDPFSFTGVAGGNPTSLTGSGHVGGIKFDGITWQGLWYISQDTAFANFDGAATWNTGQGSLTTGKYHPLAVHDALNYLAIGDGNTVLLYSFSSASSHSLVRTITLPSNFEVRWIRYNNNYLYIGTKNTKGGNAQIFVADGTSVSAQYSYIVPNSSWAFSGVIYKGVLVVISSTGQLLQLNGAGFSEIAHLPVFDTPYSWYDGNGFTNGKVENRGMTVKGDRIYIHLDGYINSPGIQLPNQPSGIWVFDPEIGLYHKAGNATDSSATYAFSGVNTSTDIITTGSTITTPTGTKVFLSATNVGGLTAARFYFFIKLSANTFQLATSYNNAIAGTFIDLTSGSTGSLQVHDDVSYGESNQNTFQPGAIFPVSDLSTYSSTYQDSTFSQLLWGAGNVLPYASSSGKYTLQTFTTGENRGSIITVKIPSVNIKDSWQKIFAKYNYLFEGNDKVLIKYRVVDKEYYPISVVSSSTLWTSSNSFTTDQNLSGVAVGDEVEILTGRGTGCCAHISALQQAAGTSWIVILDESMPGAITGDISYMISIQNWTKIGTAISTTVDSLLQAMIGKSSKWVQFKIELRGVSESFIEELQVISEENQLSK